MPPPWVSHAARICQQGQLHVRGAVHLQQHGQSVNGCKEPSVLPTLAQASKLLRAAF